MSKKKPITLVREFIENNHLDLNETDSALNSTCTTLAGFICYIINEHMDGSFGDGTDIIDQLKLPDQANKELLKVYDYAWSNSYENFWSTEQAANEYIF